MFSIRDFPSCCGAKIITNMTLLFSENNLYLRTPEQFQKEHLAGLKKLHTHVTDSLSWGVTKPQAKGDKYERVYFYILNSDQEKEMFFDNGQPKNWGGLFDKYLEAQCIDGWNNTVHDHNNFLFTLHVNPKKIEKAIEQYKKDYPQ